MPFMKFIDSWYWRVAIETQVPVSMLTGEKTSDITYGYDYSRDGDFTCITKVVSAPNGCIIIDDVAYIGDGQYSMKLPNSLNKVAQWVRRYWKIEHPITPTHRLHSPRNLHLTKYAVLE